MGRAAPLPIDELLGEVFAQLNHHPELILQAEPGAGKTTRVPPRLLDAAWATDREVIVAEPRRLAARLAARRVADERDEPLGESVGYSVRFDAVGGPHTRLRFVTTGVLLRRLLSPSGLDRVAALVLDEFHERSIEMDLCLALAVRRRLMDRPDLRLVVMSATLDPVPLLRVMPLARLVQCPGRVFPLEIRHEDAPDERPLEKRIVSACRNLLDRSPGDVLVFLPGVREIQRARDALDDLASARQLLALPLHGELPLEEQVRAVQQSGARKLVLATNVAESSITVPGVTAVVDSGLARMVRHSPWSGIPRSEIAAISQASATQRAGRAGRLTAGHVHRLYTRADLLARPAHESPEITRSDLSEVALLLRAAGIPALLDLPWIDAPPVPAVEAAEALLRQLGALDTGGQITKVGTAMAKLPTPPRVARIAVEGARRGVVAEAATVAALLGERDIRLAQSWDAGAVRRRSSGPSDLLELLDLQQMATRCGSDREIRACGLHPGRVRAVDRVACRLQRLLKKEGATLAGDAARERALLLSVMLGFPDRVARRRAPDGNQLVLCGGESAVLSDHSVVRSAPLFVAVEVEDSARLPNRSATVRLASAIEPEWLLDECSEGLVFSDELTLNRKSERVERSTRISYGSVVLEQTRAAAPAGPEVSALLVRHLLASDGFSTTQAQEVDAWRARLQLVAEHGPSPDRVDHDLPTLARALELACGHVTSLQEARNAPLRPVLEGALTQSQQRLLRELTPTHVSLPGRGVVQVHYHEGQPPWIASRLQDFFGLREGPRICGGRVPLVLQLLAPNSRAVQVTTDLNSFWQQHYPALRRQLMRRYPKHAWPEEPWNRASPPPRKTGSLPKRG